jgi:hypothetical protein
MKNQSFKVGSLIIFMIIVLALGCSQPAGGPAVPKSTAAIPGQDTSTVVNTPVSTANATTVSPAAPNPPAVKTEADLVKISDLLGNPKNYDGKVITVQGKIVSECGSGCWFTLQEGNAVIYIDLAPNNLVIPQKKGSTAKVIGKVIKEGSDVYMIGSKVDF